MYSGRRRAGEARRQAVQAVVRGTTGASASASAADAKPAVLGCVSLNLVAPGGHAPPDTSLVQGLGDGVALPSMSSLVASHVQPAGRARALGLCFSGFNIGGWVVGGWWVVRHGAW